MIASNGKTESPVLDYRVVVDDSGDPSYVNRIMIGTAVTGLVRVEWVAARYGQIIPTNWSQIQMHHWINAYMPLRYQVADAQNAIVKAALDREMEWLLLYEHDVIPPPDAFIRLNQYMRAKTHPVVSGLYYTRSRPSEPLVYRGRGVSYYDDWTMGDLVYADGVPTGFLLIHMGIIREMAKDAEEYAIGPHSLKRIFITPNDLYVDPEMNFIGASSGTSDLNWCHRVIEGGYFAKAGWDEYQEMEYPFLVDTNLFCKHINPDGTQYP